MHPSPPTNNNPIATHIVQFIYIYNFKKKNPTRDPTCQKRRLPPQGLAQNAPHRVAERGADGDGEVEDPEGDVALLLILWG